MTLLTELNNTRSPFRQAVLNLTLASSAFFGMAGFTGCSSQSRMGIDDASSFTIQEYQYSYGTDTYIKTDSGESLGTVEENNWSMRNGFSYYDSEKELQAYAEKRIVSSKVCIDIYDENGTSIGVVEEESKSKNMAAKWIFSQYYVIKNAKGEQIAKSVKSELVGTGIDIVDNDDNVVATISRSALDIGKATWSVQFKPDSDFDRRLVIFIASFQTAADNAKAE